MARDYGMNRQGLYPQEEVRSGTLPFYRRGMMAKGGPVRMKKGGHAVVDTYDYGGTVRNTPRENVLEELGRVDAERPNLNRMAEKRRLVGELKRGA